MAVFFGWPLFEVCSEGKNIEKNDVFYLRTEN